MSAAYSPPPVDGAVMSDLQARLVRLADHPDKMIIDDIVEFGKRNIHQGYHITQAVVSRFMDQRIPISHKLPILYVQDAIMKYVGGMFPYFFSRYAVDVVRRALDTLPPREASKVEFVAKTWLERALMEAPALQGLEALLATRLQAQAQAQTVAVAGAGAGGAFQPYLTRPSHLTAPHVAAAATTASGAYPPPLLTPMPPAAAAAVREGLVAREMQNILDELLVGMGGATTTLGELSLSNPALFDNIRQQADMQVAAKYPQHMQQQQQQQQQQYQQQYQQQQQQQHMSVYGMAHASAPAAMPLPPTRPTAAAAAAAAAYGAPTPPSAHTHTPYLSQWGGRHRPHVKEGPSCGLGYVGQTPVTVNLSAAAELADSLFEALSVGGGGGGGSGEYKGHQPQPQPQILPARIAQTCGGEKAFADLRRMVRQRLLDALDTEAEAPLPSILLGPIPVEPTRQYSIGLEAYNNNARKTAEMQAAGGGGGSGSGSGAMGIVRIKLPVPKFDASLLSQPKEFALQKLYLQRRYQFQDDGVRFLRQQELDAYLDKMALRRMQLKAISNAGVMCSRQWYVKGQLWCGGGDDEYDVDNAAAAAAAATATASAAAAAGGSPSDGPAHKRRTAVVLREMDLALHVASQAHSGERQRESGGHQKGTTGTGTGTGAGAGSGGAGGAGGAGGGGVSAWNALGLQDFSVPADDQFVRCPISGNLFAQRWDDDEGELFYENAAKVFVTAQADSGVFKLAKPIDHMQDYEQASSSSSGGGDADAEEEIKYLIVDRSMVLHSWLDHGKATTVRDALARYESLVNGAADCLPAGGSSSSSSSSSSSNSMNVDHGDAAASAAARSFRRHMQVLVAAASQEDRDRTFTMLALS